MNLFESSLKKQTDSIVDAAKSQFGGILLVLAVIWGVFLADHVPGLALSKWLALCPRHITGLLGVFTMPLVHGSLSHIISNTIPLIVTLITLSVLRPKQWPTVVALITVVSGAMTWILGSYNSSIVGASGLVLGLVTFLIAPGGFYLAWLGLNRFRKEAQPYPFKVKLIPIVVSALVGFFCLDNLFFNLVPVFAPMGGAGISYMAHWCGAAAGLVVAFMFARSGELANDEGKTILG